MNILEVIKDGLKVVGSIIPGVGAVSDVISAIEGASPEQVKQIENNPQMLAHEERMKELGIEEYKATQAEALAEINSEDLFTKRARPMAVYAATFATVIIALVLCYCLVVKIEIDMGAIGAILSVITPLWGNAGYYTYKRTQEKLSSKQ